MAANTTSAPAVDVVTDDAPVASPAKFARKERIFLLPENYFTHVVNDVTYQVRVVTVRREDTTVKVPAPTDTVNIFGHRSGLIDVVAFEDAPEAIQNMYVTHKARRTS